MNKIIVLHDYFEFLEGGGRLSSLLAQKLPADLGYGFARRSYHPFIKATEHIAKQKNLNAYSKIPLWRQIKLSQAFTHDTRFLTAYDTVIYSGSYSPLAIRHHRLGKNILYCHTPPRFIYDQKDFYLKRLPFWLRPVLQAFIHHLQPRYEAAVEQMDCIIANSNNVKKRIKNYLKQEATVIYPPCPVEQFTWIGQSNYYLSTARLDPLKQVDKIIQAFLQLPDKYLIISSGGDELPRLRTLAKNAPNIQFTNWIGERRLKELIGNAIAVLYLPKDEDFGMSPVESMAAGKPVIGIAEGGLLETIIPNETGILLPPPVTSEAIIQAVQTMTPQYARTMRAACEQQAQQFRTEVFLEKIQNFI